ncbi:hypothetical protein M0802_013794 [Mischocyttarus mexicanus]|nr:hypothetical protein M0802_013801 [Mischocyttarus mexicanus]KAI4482148.1 hypothetical protein M0802_013794 [Mischocyttarus mexicanus]
MDENATETYDDDIRDQPVDYSKKYVERNRLKQNHLLNDLDKDQSANEDIKECESETALYGDYAETDLDQPTDYSLRYAENDTDEDEKPTTEYFSESVQEDTIKTYCTEGTPYETPFNFSTATSMSDLRVEDTKDNDHAKKTQKKGLAVKDKKSISFEEKRSEECCVQQRLISENAERQKHIISISTNHIIPEKPISYYKEEESSSSSCVNSLSSFNSEIAQCNNVSEIISKASLDNSMSKSEPEANNSNVEELNTDKLISTSINNSPEEIKNSSRIVDKEGKMVTFSGQDFYAEQTPLMFSRCSSLGSLSGFEQHSIHDDRSSIVSDFSRRTSGIVSPSELPDSPTQTIPPSPRIQKIKSTDFMNKMQEEEEEEEEVKPSHSHLLFPKHSIKRTSVFEDDIATFKEESTPIEFSTTTSLSSLTIDDEVKSSDYLKSEDKLEEISEPVLHQNIEKDTSLVKVNILEVEKQPEQISDGDEDDEDMLAACISMGIQNNRYRQSSKTESIPKPTHSKSTSVLIPCDKKSPLNRSHACVSISPGESPAVSKICKSQMEIVVVPDTVHVYCTEDTPAGISPVGSQSNLSVLSMPSVPEDIEKLEPIKSSELECHRNDLSDESYNLSDEDEKILDECIQSGIPKVRQITPPPTKSIPCKQNPETLPQKFNLCGTPLSSPVESTSNKNPVINKPLCHISTENEKEFSDDSPNQSDDEAILIECIQSAKARLRCSPSPLLKETNCKISKHRTQCPVSLPARVQKEKIIQEQNTTQSGSASIFYPTEESYSPSEEEEEDIILAQCIQSGMPKVLNVTTKKIQRQVTTKKREEYSKSIGSSGSSTTYLLNNTYPINALYAQLPYKNVENSVSHYIVGSSSCSYNNFPTKASSSS